MKSATATQFRIWATKRLREYLVQGYAVNEHRLKQLGQIVEVLSRADNALLAGAGEVLASYLPSLQVLRDYDEGILTTPAQGSAPVWCLDISQARSIIADVRKEFPQDKLLGREREDSLEAIISAVYQSFGGDDLYPTVEEKAANLLYFVVKDHPLADGNKRSAAALFVYILDQNGLLYRDNDAARISNNAHSYDLDGGYEQSQRKRPHGYADSSFDCGWLGSTVGSCFRSAASPSHPCEVCSHKLKLK